jgi:hypothetical protein
MPISLNTVHFMTLMHREISTRAFRPAVLGCSEKLLILRLTPRGCRWPRLETTRSCRISSRTASWNCFFSITISLGFPHASYGISTAYQRRECLPFQANPCVVEGVSERNPSWHLIVHSDSGTTNSVFEWEILAFKGCLWQTFPFNLNRRTINCRARQPSSTLREKRVQLKHLDTRDRLQRAWKT